MTDTDPDVDFLAPGTPVDLSNCEREPIHVPRQRAAARCADRRQRPRLRPSSRCRRTSPTWSGWTGGRRGPAAGRRARRRAGLGGDPVGQRVRRPAGAQPGRDHPGRRGRPGARRRAAAPAVVGPGEAVVAGCRPTATRAGCRARAWSSSWSPRAVRGPSPSRTPTRRCAARSGAQPGLLAAGALRHRRAGGAHPHRLRPGDGLPLRRRLQRRGRRRGEAARLNSFLGLHYPASDIPAQARALYEKNWIRLISDVDYIPARCSRPCTRSGRPLDLTAAASRWTSPTPRCAASRRSTSST